MIGHDSKGPSVQTDRLSPSSDREDRTALFGAWTVLVLYKKVMSLALSTTCQNERQSLKLDFLFAGLALKNT